ncbi:MAG: ATP-binding cassette subfamily F protein 3 [Bacteroidia bacterium]|jgi:ATP-binding cassette subfamily F protein 3
MIAIQDISYYLGDRALYDTASLHIKPKDRIGLIGLNGTGKSTLLKMIVGDIQPTEGTISMPKDYTIGFLNQDLLSYQTNDSILHVAMEAFSRQLELQDQIDAILKKMETDYDDKLLEKLAKAQDEFATLEGYSIQAKAGAILEGLGFSTKDLDRPLKEFSGGWRMRVMLAKLLLQKPSLLMLDEPTNHLDLPSIQWLESYLTAYEGAIIIVSHDKHFLDRAVNQIVEILNSDLNVYAGNYTFYEQEKELRNEIQANAFKNQQQSIKQAEKFIERFKAKATKAKQAQSKMKMLDKMDRVAEVEDENFSLDFDFTFSQTSGKIVATIEDATKRYGDLTILENTDVIIERGDKIALIGANGKGKSTLLRMVTGDEPFEGSLERGHNLIEAFYAQHQLEALTVENSIIEELKQAGSQRTELELRNLLGCFLFTGDDVFKKIRVLSGGEKSRVALTKTLISQANFLMLDEPTNHLDMLSVGILANALQKYEGTYLVVSHDRDFIDKIANKIWYIEDFQIKEYPGTYSEYNTWRSEKEAKELQDKQSNSGKSNQKSKKKEEKPKKVQLNREQQKEFSRQLSKAKKAVAELERQIETLEKEKKNLEAEMAKPAVYGNPDLLFEATQKYDKVKSDLEQANEDWTEKAMELEELG